MIHTAAADVWVEPDGTLVVRFQAGCRVHQEAGEEVTRAYLAAADGRRCPVLVDLGGLASVDRATRERGAGPDIAAVTTRMALLVRSPLTRLIGDYFLRVTRPPYPLRLFTDEHLARRWLTDEGVA